MEKNKSKKQKSKKQESNSQIKNKGKKSKDKEQRQKFKSKSVEKVLLERRRQLGWGGIANSNQCGGFCRSQCRGGQCGRAMARQ
jgi:hypothetical protein